ncbi:MAG: hypothetical protein K2X48_02990 [Chitinophagaceae bacterium]|nr:hypothetical protein [Chitinophagaceae bacterium]
MNTGKFLIGGLIGGVINFVLGYLVYGLLLMNFFGAHTTAPAGVMRPMENMVWWALIAGNLTFGLLVSYVLNKGGVKGISPGFIAGAVIGLLFSLSVDLYLYAQITLWDTTYISVDVICSVVMSGIVGAVVGWYNGR